MLNWMLYNLYFMLRWKINHQSKLNYIVSKASTLVKVHPLHKLSWLFHKYLKHSDSRGLTLSKASRSVLAYELLMHIKLKTFSESVSNASVYLCHFGWKAGPLLRMADLLRVAHFHCPYISSKDLISQWHLPQKAVSWY